MGSRALREKVCVDKMGSRAWREKVCVDKMGSGAVQHNHHRPRQSRFRAILVFRGVVVGVAKANYAPGAGRDLILPTQRIRDIKISMVWICMVKVRFAYLALAHVSHFFCRPGAVGLQAIDAFFTF